MKYKSEAGKCKQKTEVISSLEILKEEEKQGGSSREKNRAHPAGKPLETMAKANWICSLKKIGDTQNVEGQFDVAVTAFELMDFLFLLLF